MAASCGGGGGGDGGSVPVEREMVWPSNWSRLPSDLVAAVARKITTIDDYVRFRAVCPSWRSAAPARAPHLPTQLPWLMLPYRADDDGVGEMVFYCPTRWEFLHLAGAGRVRFCASSHGWLLMVEENSPAASLRNPVTGAAIPLPPLSTLPSMVGVERSRDGEYVTRNMYESYIRKIVLSSDPAMDDDVVVLALDGTSWSLAFCRLGDDSWRCVDVPALGVIQDVAYHGGQFYVIFGSGRLAICDLSPTAGFRLLNVAAHDAPSLDHDFPVQDYLVESTAGDLLLVSQYKSNSLCFDDNPYTLSFTTRFVVSKLKLDGRPGISMLKSIGDDVLFLGPNGSVSISASRFPGRLQGNSIYAADSNCVPSYGGEVDTDESDGDGDGDGDDDDDGLPPDEEEDAEDLDGVLPGPDGFRRHDIFVFNLRAGQWKLLRCYLYDSSPGWQPPLWFTPSLSQ